MSTRRQLDRRRLALVAARFDSPHDGERLAALEAFGRLLAASGATWADLIDGPGEPADAKPDEGRDPSHIEIIVALARDGVGLITPWESQFLRGLLSFHTLSDKQRDLLARIRAKVEAVQGMSA